VGAPDATDPSGGSEIETFTGSPYTAAATSYPVYKLNVTKNGIYRMTQSYLLNPSTGVAQGLSGADPRQFKIMNRGVEIPTFVQGESDGTFDAADSIEFYGQKLDAAEALLNFTLVTGGNIYQYDDYGDRNVYWLSVDPNGVRSRVTQRSAAPDANFAIEPDFAETIHSEVDTLFLPTGGDDPFLMAPRLNSNNGSIAADANTCNYTNPGVPSQVNGSYLGPGFTDPNNVHYCPVCSVPLAGVNAAASSQAVVSVRLRGTTTESGVVPDHLTVVELNDVTSQYGAACWSGTGFFSQTVNIPHSALTGTLDIRIEEPGLAATAVTEQVLVDYTEVSYRRLFQTVNDGLRFSLPDQSKRIAVSALSTNNAANVSLYEITNTIQPLHLMGGPPVVSPVRITGGVFSGSSGNFTLTFTAADDPNASVNRVYHVAGPGAGGLLVPDSVVQDVASTLLDPANEADAIYIGDPNVMDTSPSSAFTAYVNHRASADGFAVKAVNVADVYDEFGYGIAHPQALKNFLNYAYDNWKGPFLDLNRPAPAFVTLVGDTTADPKNNLNRSDWINVVPTYIMLQINPIIGFWSSDNFIAAFRGTDQMPDIHLGRLPLRTAVDGTNVFTKLHDYETVFPAGTWRGRGTFIADEGKVAGESAEFERVTDDVINNYWNPKPPHEAVRIYYDDPNYNNGNNPTKIRNDIIAAHNNGTALMTFTGHGAFSIWGVDGWWTTSNVASLAANGIYSFQINENCLSGGFHALGATDALSEAFVKAAGKGSIAFFAPAGLSFSFIGEVINGQVYGDIFGPRRERRFGTLITNVRVMLGNRGNTVDQQSYTLVGDPTSVFAVPAPKPPRDMMAVAGDAVVDLSWTASLDPNVQTRIFRATSPAGTYTLLTPAPLTGTSFHDPNVANGTAYYYEAASVDGLNYEGPRSNFNSDCVTSNLPASGPDCLWAKPLNPDPPQTPAGTFVFDDGSGTRLEVVWDPNPENDLVDYLVEYGTQQGGPYPVTISVSPVATGKTLTGLVTGTTYYIRVSARNTSGLTSPPSAEMAGRPSAFEGQNPPALIVDLRIDPTPGDANSLTLSWTRPSLDIYGDPTMAASFSIYRDTFPTFVPSPSNRIATITDPNATSHVDVGARTALPNYYYLVTSADVRGFVSGAGNELPGGVSDLTSEMPVPGFVHFSWSPVTTDLAGEPVTIAKYVLYASGTPVTRGMTDALTPVADNIQGTSVDVAENPAHKFYSLIVVDMRGNKSPF